MKCGYGDIMKMKRVITDPSVIASSSDDSGSQDPDHAIEMILDDPRVVALMPHKNSMFIFVAMNTILYEVHAAIIDGPTRKNFMKHGRAVLDYMFANTTCQKVMALIPEYNRATAIFAGNIGFKREGVLTESFFKDEVLHDQIVFGLKKIEYLNHIRGTKLCHS